MKRHTLHRSEILRGYGVFSEVMKNGTRFVSPSLHCYISAAHAAPEEQVLRTPRLTAGFVVSKRSVPRAVDRNRLKRLMREVYRQQNGEIKLCAEERCIETRIVLMILPGGAKNIRRISFGQLEESWAILVPEIIKHIRAVQ